MKRTYTIDIKKLGEYEKALPSMYKKAFLFAAKKFQPEALAELEKATKNAPPASDTGQIGAVASTKYIKGWRAVLKSAPMSLSFFNIAKNSRGKEYAEAVEYGRSPGARMPPVAAIRSWMRAKGISATVPASQQQRIALLIARKIKQRGLRARLIMQGVNQSRTGNLVKRFYRYMRESMAVYI